MFRRFVIRLGCPALWATCLGLSLGPSAWAEGEGGARDTTATVDVAPADDSLFSVLDTPREVVSEGLRDFTNLIDNWFFTEKVYYETTGSFLRLSLDSIWDEETRDMGYNGNIRLKLNLQRTKKRLKFVIESDADKESEAPDGALKAAPVDVVDQAEYYAGIQAQAGSRERWLYHLTLGAKAHRPPDLFLRLRATRRYQWERWSMRLDEGLYWFKNDGPKADTSVEFDYPLTADRLFRSRSFAQWTDTHDYVDLNQTFSLFHGLDARRLIAYQAGVHAITQPTVFAQDYFLDIRYRQDIHKQYLFMEIVPQVSFIKAHSFHPDHSFLVRLEWLFTS